MDHQGIIQCINIHLLAHVLSMECKSESCYFVFSITGEIKRQITKPSMVFLPLFGKDSSVNGSLQAPCCH